MSSRRGRGSDLIVGRFVAHGRAPYKFQPQQDESYYLKILTDAGRTQLLWGKDLARALAASKTQPKPGDRIGARRIGREPVTFAARTNDDGRAAVPSEAVKYRTRWQVEKAAYLVERAKLARRVRDAQADARQSVRQHPELAGTYVTLRAAQEFAERRIADPKERERFIARMREVMTHSIRKGEPMPAVQLREPANVPAPTSVTPPRKRDDEPTR